MGILSKFAAKCKEAWNKGVEVVKKTVKAVKESVTNVWNKVSGKTTFEEADQLYEEITEKYNRMRSHFHQETERLIDEIEHSVKAINESKQCIQAELFVRMAGQLEKIKDVRLPEGFSLVEYKASVLETDSLRSKGQLYSIDFNKHKFKTSVQAVLTLGFYTRKKANETLLAVQNEKDKIENEIAKMDAELEKLNAVLESLQNVEHYFDTFISLYEKLLVRLDHSVHHLLFTCMLFASKVIDSNLSIGWLPIAQQKEIEALISASKILKVVAQFRTESMELSATSAYESEIKKGFEQFEANYYAA